MILAISTLGIGLFIGGIKSKSSYGVFTFEFGLILTIIGGFI